MKVGAALPANEQTPIAMKPREGALDLPAVSPESFFGFNSRTGDAWRNVSSSAGGAVLLGAIGLVGMQLVGTFAWATARAGNGLYRVEHRLQHLPIVDIGRGQRDNQRQAVSVGQQVMFATRTSAVAWVGSAIWAPLFAGTSDASSMARFQLMRPASPNSWCRCANTKSQTPAKVQSRSRRQHVIPLPHPSSRGRSSHGIPVLSTNTIPVSTLRSSSRRRPPLGRAGWAGSRGSILFHNSSGRSSRAMPPL